MMAGNRLRGFTGAFQGTAENVGNGFASEMLRESLRLLAPSRGEMESGATAREQFLIARSLRMTNQIKCRHAAGFAAGAGGDSRCARSCGIRAFSRMKAS